MQMGLVFVLKMF